VTLGDGVGDYSNESANLSLDSIKCRNLEGIMKYTNVQTGVKKWAGTRRYGVPADDISVPADSASEIVKFTISIPRESCTNAKGSRL